MKSENRELAILTALILAMLLGWFIFRAELGLVVFLALGVAVFVQLIRVALGSGQSKTLKALWQALKDGFWGIG